MASITIRRGTEEEVQNTPIQDGQILFTTDNVRNNKIVADVSDTERILIGGNNDFVGTRAQFEEAKEGGLVFDGMAVNLTDDYTEFDPNAVNINYDPTQSGLGDNVQEALDTVSEVMAVDSIPSGLGDGTIGGAIATLNTNITNIYGLQYIDITTSFLSYLIERYASNNNLLISLMVKASDMPISNEFFHTIVTKHRGSSSYQFIAIKEGGRKAFFGFAYPNSSIEWVKTSLYTETSPEVIKTLSANSKAIGGYYGEFSYSDLSIPNDAKIINVFARNDDGIPIIATYNSSVVRISSNTSTIYVTALYV